jgi:D-alanyl-D-alanine carboxypeptidase
MKGVVFFLIFLNVPFFLQNLYSVPISADLVVEEGSGRILHSQNSNVQTYPASLVKMMTLYLLFERLSQKKIVLTSCFKTSRQATYQAPSRLDLKEGETIRVEEAIKALITKSANDVAYVVAENLCGSVDHFVKLMNKKAQKLGMISSIFYNPHGLPSKKQNRTTAYDMMLLSRSLYKHFPRFVHYFKLKSFTYKGKVFRTYNHVLERFKEADGIKTGFINLSGFNVSTTALLKTKNGRLKRIFVVVMGGKSYLERDNKAISLFKYAQDKINT